jgi:hypothetical protein
MEERTQMDRDRNESQDHEVLVEFALGRLSPAESLRILDRVSADDELSADLDLVLLMLNEGEREGLLHRRTYGPSGDRGSRLREWSTFSLTVLRTAAMLFMVLGVGLILREVTKPDYADLAAVGSSDLDFRMRGRAEDVLGLARAMVMKGEYDDGLRMAEWYLSVYPDGNERSEAHVLKGALLLVQARKSKVGVFLSFDASLVDAAWTELQSARLARDFVRTREHVAWFEAKALLMKGNVQQARALFESVALMGGVRNDDAKRLLLTLNSEAHR